MIRPRRRNPGPAPLVHGPQIVGGYYVSPVLYQWGIYSAATGKRMALYSTKQAAEADLRRYATAQEGEHE